MKNKLTLSALVFTAMGLMVLNGCGPVRPHENSEGHISKGEIKVDNDIPAPVAKTVLLPAPRTRPRLETYTVIVNDVPVKELLFSMARDAKLNLDIHEDIAGNVTLNAIDQTLPQILERLVKQVDVRYELEDGNLRIRADLPYIRTYKVDYVNMSRESKGEVRVATTLGSTGQGSVGSDGGSAGGSGDNSSLTEVVNKSDNKFWETLAGNISSLIARVSEKNDKNQVIVNKETGLIAVNATYKQHVVVQGFLDQVLTSAKRQVLIEATIAEIKLSERYQSGVDWSLLASDPTDGISLVSEVTGANLASSPFTSLTIADKLSGDQLGITLRALEEFGDVKVLSSPKVMAINNQSALLKVVDNYVYFEMNIETTSTQVTSNTTLETEIRTVPVGFVMSVTPYINEHDMVTLNIRPTISRVIDKVEDPNPAFKNAGIVSEIPVIQVREIESVLQVGSGDTAIIGGLMQDTVNDQARGVPYLSKIPVLGALFRYEDDISTKSELVIFIRPVVIKEASLTSDLAEYQRYMPPENAKKEDKHN